MTALRLALGLFYIGHGYCGCGLGSKSMGSKKSCAVFVWRDALLVLDRRRPSAHGGVNFMEGLALSWAERAKPGRGRRGRDGAQL